MGDFLASYYDRGEFSNGELDENVISQHMALLHAEQPVSILDMDQLIESQKKRTATSANRLPARLRQVDFLNRSTTSKTDPTNDCFALEEASIPAWDDDDDLDIPVASMSTIEQGIPSMVSVQLTTIKGRDLTAGKGMRGMGYQIQRKLELLEPELEYDDCSPLSAARLVEAQRIPRRKFTLDIGTKVEEKKEEVQEEDEEEESPEMMYEEIVKCEQRAAMQAAQPEKVNLRGALLRFWGRRQEWRNKNK